jgi:hypothetical protein
MILGSYFCRLYDISLDYGTETIRFGNGRVLKALSKDEEASTIKSRRGAQKGPVEHKVAALATDN